MFALVLTICYLGGVAKNLSWMPLILSNNVPSRCNNRGCVRQVVILSKISSMVTGSLRMTMLTFDAVREHSQSHY